MSLSDLVYISLDHIMRVRYNIRLEGLACDASISGGRDAFSPGKHRAVGEQYGALKQKEGGVFVRERSAVPADK